MWLDRLWGGGLLAGRYGHPRHEIESNLNNQSNLDTEKLVKLNREYAELRNYYIDNILC